MSSGHDKPRGDRDSECRLTNGNGYRDRRWDTRVGTLDLSIPRVRDGSYFPSLLEPRRRAERALLAVVQEAYVLGVSHPPRRGSGGGPRDRLDQQERGQPDLHRARRRVEAFRSRSLADETYPYLWLDASYVKVREGGRVVSMAALVATGVAPSGERRILDWSPLASHSSPSRRRWNANVDRSRGETLRAQVLDLDGVRS